MSLSWLRHHARSRNRGTTRRRCTDQRLTAQRTLNPLTSARAYAPRITYDNSFVVDNSVTFQDAKWVSDDQCKRQYHRLGWEVVPIRKDGNCLFRSLSDQLYGHERRHLELRRRLVDFINLERAFFEPLVVEGGVVEHCARLREAGASGGHPELVAAAKLLGVNIIVHIGPVKRLCIDCDKSATTKEGRGKTIYLLLKLNHFSSLRKREIPLEPQHGCSDMCLCKRIVTPSRASLDARASISDRPSDLGLSPGDRNSDVTRRSSLQSRLKGAYGRKPVPDAPNHSSSSETKRTKVANKPKSRSPPPPQKPKTPAPPLPSPAVPVEPTTSVPTVPIKPKTSTPESPALFSDPKATAQTSASIMSPSAPRTVQKSPGVVLFLPESLNPVVEAKTSLVVLFEPDQSCTKLASPRQSTATPLKPTALVSTKNEPESASNGLETVLHSTVRRPRRAVFNGGKRRRSSVAALSLLQEVSMSLSVSATEGKITPIAEPVKTVAKQTVEPVSGPNRVTAVKPNPPVPHVQIKKSSKKVFRQGRPVPAAC